MKRRMPGVSISRPDIRDAIERHQPYGHVWLKNLSKLARHSKHRYLTLHTQEDVDMDIYWDYYDYTDWRFVDPHVSVLLGLEAIEQGVTAAVRDICQVAGF
jgi:hypothetical protein